MTANRGGLQIGREYVDALRRYLDNICALPARGGKLNVTAVAEASGVPRQSLYKNDECRALLEAAVETKGLVGIVERAEGTGGNVVLERRLTALEQKNAALMAENHELRRQLRRYRHIDEMLEQGRRVMP